MTKQVAILRGINVGGKHKIRMVDLRMLFEGLGFTGIQTYIQSGNVIFDTTTDPHGPEFSNMLEKAIAEKFGYNVPVVTRSALEIKMTVQDNPFIQGKNTDIERLHVTFLKKEPPADKVATLEQVQADPDRFSIRGKDVFIYCHHLYSKTKLSNGFFEKMLDVPTTTRNWKTVLALAALCET